MVNDSFLCPIQPGPWNLRWGQWGTRGIQAEGSWTRRRCASRPVGMLPELIVPPATAPLPSPLTSRFIVSCVLRPPCQASCAKPCMFPVLSSSLKSLTAWVRSFQCANGLRTEAQSSFSESGAEVDKRLYSAVLSLSLWAFLYFAAFWNSARRGCGRQRHLLRIETECSYTCWST